MISKLFYKILYMPFTIFSAWMTVVSVLFQSTVDNKNIIDRDEYAISEDSENTLEYTLFKVLTTFREHMELPDKSTNIPILEPYRKMKQDFGIRRKGFRFAGQLEFLEIRGLSSFKINYLNVEPVENNDEALRFMTQVLIQKLNIASLFKFKCDFLKLLPLNRSGYFIVDLTDIVIMLKGSMDMPQADIHHLDIHVGVENIKLDVRGFSTVMRAILQTFVNSFGIPLFKVVWPSFKNDLANWLEQNIIMSGDLD